MIPLSQPKNIDEKFTNSILQKINYGAFGLHLVSAIAVAIAFGVVNKKANFDTNLWSYKITQISDDDRDIDLVSYPYLDIGTIPLETLVVVIFFITSLFHIFYATSPLYYTEINNGYNRYRWLEYGITSSLMIFVLCIISGVKDFDTVILLTFMNGFLMSFGYFFEMSQERQAKLISLVMGFFMLLVIWFTIFRNFFYRVDEVNKVSTRKIPTWIYGVLIPMFFWWISFGLVAMIRYIKGGDPRKYEFFYILLSYLSKAFMGYYLTYGILREPEPEKPK
jgi:hypothetical protein